MKYTEGLFRSIAKREALLKSDAQWNDLCGWERVAIAVNWWSEFPGGLAITL